MFWPEIVTHPAPSSSYSSPPPPPTLIPRPPPSPVCGGGTITASLSVRVKEGSCGGGSGSKSPQADAATVPSGPAAESLPLM